jgi:hypothetical protein
MMPHDQILERLLTDFPDITDKWGSLKFGPAFKMQDRKAAQINLYGMTKDDPPRFFMVWFYIDPNEESVPLIESKATNSILTIDTYLDPRCECKPTPGQFIGEHCKFHQERYGMRY